MDTKRYNQFASPEFEYFINTPLNKYEGQYIAILGKKIISFGSSAKEVWDRARKKYPGSHPTIAKIPKKEIMIMVWR